MMITLHVIELTCIALLFWYIAKQGDQITRLRGAVFDESLDDVMKEG